MQRSEELGLIVVDEDDNETLLVHSISSEDIYRRQEGERFAKLCLLKMIFILFNVT